MVVIAVTNYILLFGSIYFILYFKICRFITGIIYSFTFVYSAELFPTVVRSTALGYLSASGTIGSIACPFIVSFSKNILRINPFVVMGVMALIGALSLIPLKDTLG